MKKLLLSLLILVTVAPSVFAKDIVIFSCFTNKGKQIAIVESNGYYEYSFGVPGKPELFFKNPVKAVEDRSEKWNGVGAWYWEEYNLKNGEYYYLVQKSVNRMSEEHEMSGGVIVYKGNKELTQMPCERF